MLLKITIGQDDTFLSMIGKTMDFQWVLKEVEMLMEKYCIDEHECTHIEGPPFLSKCHKEQCT